MTDNPAARPSRLHARWWPASAAPALAILGVVFVVYHRVLPAYFFEDDFQWLAGTLSFRPSGLLNIAAFTHFYRPVIELYFWIGVKVFDGSPVLFHASSLGLHGLNGILLMTFGNRVTQSRTFGFVAALFFVVLPGHSEAVAWVGALAEPVSAVFGLCSILWLLEWRSTGRRWARALSPVAFWFAVMTHESSVVILLLLVLADWTFTEKAPVSRRGVSWGWIRDQVRTFLPYLAVLCVYLAVDLTVNRGSYIVQAGDYYLGLHTIRNVLGYIVWLYIGKQNAVSFVAITIVVVALLARGTPRVRFATLWVLIALLPFSLFTWGNISRYLYLAGIGFSLLLAEGLFWLDRRLAPRLSPRVRLIALGVLLVVLVVRFSVFTSKAVAGFARRTELYREFGEQYRRTFPNPPPGTGLPLDPLVEARLTHRYLEGLIRWEYQDPTLRLVLTDPQPR